MITFSAVGYVLARFLMALGATMLLPAAYGLAVGGGGVGALAVGALATVAAGVLTARLSSRPGKDLSQREGILLVVAVWTTATLFGSLPFYFSGYFPSFTDAYFEATSGFTTTGATVLPIVEVLPPALQFWRCFSHWLGGMGIVLLGIAILPLVGHGGMQLYRAEFSGARSERLKPRIVETALALWKIYLALTVSAFVALRAAGMNSFDALCHAFSTIGTGGFSTRTASIAAFDSVLIEIVVMVFMLLSGISFVQHYRVWAERSPLALFRDVEVRWFLLIALVGAVAASASLLLQGGYDPAEALRAGAFQAASIITTTGYVSDDFELWSPLPQFMLLALMFIGGCTGSTAGGIKVSRVLLLARVVDREFKQMVERRGVFSVRLGGKVIGEPAIQSLLNLVHLALVLYFVGVLLLAASGVDVLTSVTAVAASMFNIGPGLGGVGPAEHFGGLPVPAKWVLAFCMLAGRLEFYTMIVILTPAFWRK